MTKVTMAFVWDHPKPNEDWKLNTHVWEESGDTDSVRTHNLLNRQILDAVEKWLVNGDPSRIVRKTPEEAGVEAYRVFDIYLEARPSRDKKKPYIKVDYKKYRNCPQPVAANLMEVVAEFRRKLKPILVK